MQSITTVTQKGQVTIPKPIRDELLIKERSAVLVERDDGFVKIVPQKTLLDVAPLAYAPKGKNALKGREYMAKYYKRA